jgi:arginase
VTVVVVPYHQDDRLPNDLIPLPAGRDHLLVDTALPDGNVWRRLAALDDAVANQVAAAVGTGRTTTVISGDCLVGIATLAGVQRAGIDPALIWFDAHGDVHTLETTTSGYLGGLSLRLALGAHADLLAPLRLRPVDEGRTILVGARDLDLPEVDYLAASAVRQSGVAGLDADGLPGGRLVLHLDVDVVDPADLPGLLFPAPDGPAAATVLAAVQRVLDTGRVVALDVACTWHPTYNGRVRQTRAALIAALVEMVSVPRP